MGRAFLFGVGGSKEEQEKTVALAMTSGNQVIYPDSGKVLSGVVIQKPVTLLAENIKKDIDIGNVVGSYIGIPSEPIDDWVPNPTWWDIEAIFEADVPPTGLHKVAIMLLLAQGNATNFNNMYGGGYKCNDMTEWTWAYAGSHAWNTAQDKPCLIDGIEAYKTRYVIFYSTTTSLVTLDPGAEVYAITTPIPIYAYVRRMAPSTTVTLQFGGTTTKTQSLGLQGIKIRGYDSTSRINLADYCFSYCMNIEKIDIDTTLIDYVGIYCFYVANKLKNIFFKLGVTLVPDYYFSSVYHTKTIVVPEGVTQIGSNAFAGCFGLESIILPNSLISIGTSSLYNLNYVKSIVLPASLVSIGINAFTNTKVTRLVIQSNLTTIGSGAFSSMSALMDFKVLPDFDFAISLLYSELLSRESILALFNNLKNNTEFTAKILTLGTMNLAKMTTAEKLIATNKNWTLA